MHVTLKAGVSTITTYFDHSNSKWRDCAPLKKATGVLAITILVKIP